MIDIKEIMNIMPHRYPFLLVDRIESMKEGEEVVGLKNVSINEPFFAGHFPGSPIMPGVLIIEAMAQVGGILAFRSGPKEWSGSLVYFMGMDKVRFRKPVLPGDQLRLRLTMMRQKQRVFKMRGEAYVEDALVAEAELMAAIEESKQAETSADES
ncbi:MAG: 3-hydroxyacyl-ACP dehydratase FabZ [Deltaproteobacteria bacterium]|nr:MAG: 3-hydroxyacyl-ACP dehydratase FabZ [Deltaproteobacteria bacterium]